jgi:hypothetical protein
MPVFDLGLGRHVGLTHVLDKGFGPRAWEDLLDVAGDHVSIVKLGWGTAYVTQNLERKLDVLREKRVVIGGTFFEAVYARDRIDDYKRWLTELGLDHVEISDGTVEIPRAKLELIADSPATSPCSRKSAQDSSVEYGQEWTLAGRSSRPEPEGDAEAREGAPRDLRLERRDAHRADRRGREVIVSQRRRIVFGATSRPRGS